MAAARRSPQQTFLDAAGLDADLHPVSDADLAGSAAGCRKRQFDQMRWQLVPAGEPVFITKPQS
jgi:hypothetical protein